MSQARFQKMQREKARRERAAAKVARKEERRQESAEAEPPAAPVDQTAVLDDLARLHERFEAKQIEFDDFVAEKERLTELLDIR